MQYFLTEKPDVMILAYHLPSLLCFLRGSCLFFQLMLTSLKLSFSFDADICRHLVPRLIVYMFQQSPKISDAASELACRGSVGIGLRGMRSTSGLALLC